MDRKKEDLKVEWIGMDGFLVALYLVLVAFLGYGMFTLNDTILGVIAPWGLMIAATVIFLAYLKTLFGMAIKANQERKQ